MDGLDAGRDARGGEAGPVRRVDELEVLDPGHEGQPPRGRFQRVERGPDRGVPDRVDLGRDPAGRGAVDEVAQRLGLGHPDAPATLGRERVVGLRSMSARRAAVREPSEPSA